MYAFSSLEYDQAHGHNVGFGNVAAGTKGYIFYCLVKEDRKTRAFFKDKEELMEFLTEKCTSAGFENPKSQASTMFKSMREEKIIFKVDKSQED